MRIFWHDGSKNIIGQRVKKAREKASPALTQDALSARLATMGYNVDRVSISKIENGDRFVPDYEVVAFAQALKVTANWLLTGKD